MKMELSKQYFERAKKVAPGGVHSPVRAFKSVGGEPVFFKSAQGAELTTVDGQKVIDFCQSFGPLLLGHRDPDVTKVVQEMVQTAWSFGACEPYSLLLAEFITSRVPWVQKVRFVSSGTEAVMSALRVARAFTKRNKILKFDGCYHGHADSLLVKAGSGLAGLGDGQSAADSAGVSAGFASETLVAPLDDLESLEMIFSKNKGEIAAIIIEPLPANYGLLIQQKEFLLGVAEIARKNGALLIFDEVISGFRVSLGGMAEVTGIRPDLVTYGKVIGGGFPVGAYGGRAEIMDLVAPLGPVYQAGTLSANPIGMAAGLATLQKVEKENVYAELESRASTFASKLKKVFAERGAALDISRMGSIFWIHPKLQNTIRRLEQIPSDHAANFKGFFHNCLDNGVYLAPSGYEVGFIGLAHTTEILNDAVTRIDQALR